MLRNPVFHPYAGIIRIRLEGIISACTRRHPLKSAAKLVQISEKPKKIKIFFSFSERDTFERIAPKVSKDAKDPVSSAYWNN